jgi:hypothetical protein
MGASKDLVILMEKISFYIIRGDQTTHHETISSKAEMLNKIAALSKWHLPDSCSEDERRGWQAGMDYWNPASQWVLMFSTIFEETKKDPINASYFQTTKPFNTSHFKAAKPLGVFLYSIFMLWQEISEIFKYSKLPIKAIKTSLSIDEINAEDFFWRTCLEIQNAHLNSLAFGIPCDSIALWKPSPNKNKHHKLISEEIKKLKKGENPYNFQQTPYLFLLVFFSTFFIEKYDSDKQQIRQVKKLLRDGAWKNFLDSYSRLNTHTLNCPDIQIVTHHPDGKLEYNQLRKKGQAKKKVMYSPKKNRLKPLLCMDLS